MARLLYLEGEDPEEPIELRINSPGGEVPSGLAIIDTIGQLACSGRHHLRRHGRLDGLGAAGLGDQGPPAGHRERPRADPPAVGRPVPRAEATDPERAAEEILRQRARIDQLLADATGQPVDRIHRDTERDTWFSAEALEYGLIDEVLGR